MAIIDNLKFNQKNLKKLMAFAVLAIVIAVSAYFLNIYLSYGEVSINSEPQANIYEIAIVGGKYNQKLLGKGHITNKYKAGSYTFNISDGEKSSMQTVAVLPRKKYSYQINLIPLSIQSKVLSALATNIQASNGELRYVNGSYNYLEVYRVGNKSPSNYPMAQSVDNINAAQWVGDKKALLKYYNKSYGYLDNNNVQFFSPLPKSGNKQGESDYLVNQIFMNSNLNILSQLNSDIYFQKSINSEPVRVVSDLKAANIIMGLGNNYFAYSTSNKLVDSSRDVTLNSSREDNNIYVISNNDKAGKKTVKSGSNVAAINFSQSGDKLLFVNSSGINIYDMGSEKSYIVYSKTPEKALITTWIDNSHILYFDYDGIWIMNIDTSSSYKVSASENNRYIVSASVSMQKNKIFFTTQTPNQYGNSNTVYSLEIKN
jgi:hypothetical protein